MTSNWHHLRRYVRTIGSVLLVCGLWATGSGMLPGVGFGASTASADDEIWSQDVAASVAQAKEEDKDLLLLFTGSDWCPPCQKLEENVLDTELFAEQAPQYFELVKLDFPQNIEQSADLKQQNQEWAERLGITGYPTIALLDPQQRPYAFTGFREGGAEEYVQHLKTLVDARRQRDEYWRQAKEAEGLERAKLLDQALSQMDQSIAELYYEDVIKEIVELDSDDEAGLRTKYYAARDRELRKALMTDIAIAARLRKPADAIQYIDRRMGEMKLPPQMKLQAMNYKLQLLKQMDRVDDALELLDTMIEIPELTAAGVQRLIVKKVYLLVGADKHDEAVALLNREIAERVDNLHLLIAKGELLDSRGDYQGAIRAYERSMTAASSRPDLYIDLVGAKADAQFELDKSEEALATLDQFIDNADMPADLRAEALLHKAMMLRELGRTTAAIRAETKATEVVKTPEEKGEFQILVEQIREKLSGGNVGG